MSRILLLAVLLAPLALAQPDTLYFEPTPSPLAGLDYAHSLFSATADHDPDVPRPRVVLGFDVGQQVATSEQIVEYARRLAEASDRIELVEYGRTYEGRPLVYLAISSPGNLARSDEIKSGMARLADPSDLASGERERLIDELPGVAWMGYSIHGNESSGADAALAVMYHLAADRSEATAGLLEDLVVIVDPNMNPDGRMRFVNGVHQARGEHPNVDDQSLVHSGYWPYGRGNHYLFDLNRDWIYARHPETRGRIPHVIDWKPLLFVDAHEMGSQDTFLFSPPRKPHNPHLPPYGRDTAQQFADDQARALDQYGYPYYSGEWNENWYPGYSDAWAALRGAQGILYEQARIAEDGVQRPTHLISYRQAVHHQFLSTFANLETLRENRRAMLTQYADDRANMVSPRGPYGERTFVILPSDNAGRMNDLLDLLRIQEFEVHRLTESLEVSRATDLLGRERRRFDLPAGSLVIPNRQPAARLVAAMFEFDPQISDEALVAERKRILKEGGSTLYDTTSWNIPMMFGLDAVTVPEHISGNLEPVDFGADDSARPAEWSEDLIALVASGADDRAVALAGRLLERGVNVRASTRASELDGIALPVGSIAVTLDDNRGNEDWTEAVRTVADALGLAVQAVDHGRAPGELADLGGEYWQVLTAPKIALVGRGSTNMSDFGAVWYVLDHRLGIRHSHLDESRASWGDLRRYNVLYLPDRWGGGGLPESLKTSLGEWVRNGGTLVATDAAARALTGGEEPLVKLRTLSQVIGEELAAYQDALYREWQAANQPLPDAVWGHAAPDQADYPWNGLDESLPDADERKRRDQWQRQFMPSGAMVATRVDAEHWLAAGTGEYLTVLMSRSPILMSDDPDQTPLRIGVHQSSDEREHRLINWSPVPAGQELIVRAGGLLWPEARERITNGAWIARESVGRGQVILFAHPPAFRGAQLGAIRLLENALILGPGLGTSQPVELP